MTRFIQGLALAAALILGFTPPVQAQTYYGTALVAPPTVLNDCAAWANSDTGTNALTDSGVGCEWGDVMIQQASPATSMWLQPSIPGFPNSPAIVNKTSQQPVILTKGVAVTGTDAGDFKCYRNANYTGGTPGFVNPCFSSYTVNRAGTTSYEWSFLARLDNYGTSGDGSQDVAAYFQARKLGTGATWASTTEIYDQSANPTTGSLTDEHDMSVTGGDSSHNRVILDMYGRGCPVCGSGGGADTSNREIWAGIRLNVDSSTGAAGGTTTIDHGILFGTVAGSGAAQFGDGINFTSATYQVAPIVMADGQDKVCFTVGCGAYLWHSSGVFYFYGAGANQVSITDAGALYAPVSLGSGGAITLTAGNKLCLDGVTCANYISQSSGNVSIAATNQVNVGLLSALSVSASGAISASGALTTGTKLCLDAITCNNTISQSAGTITITNSFGGAATFGNGSASFGNTSVLSLSSSGSISGTGISGSSETISGNSSAANYILPTSGKLCMSGSGCGLFFRYDGTNFNFFNGSTDLVNISGSSGLVTSANGFAVSFSTGVSCSGAPTSSFASVGGIVTHC